MSPEKLNMRERALVVLRGGIPPRLPLITRLETWYLAHQRNGTLPVRFREMNTAWRGRPLIWGAIPTPILEEHMREQDFRAYMADLLACIDQPVILGLVDLFMRHNSIERVKYIAEEVERMDFIQRVQTMGARPT